MKDIFDKEFRSKLEYRRIYDYIKDDKLEIEQIMKEYTNYIYKIIKNYSLILTTEDNEKRKNSIIY